MHSLRALPEPSGLGRRNGAQDLQTPRQHVLQRRLYNLGLTLLKPTLHMLQVLSYFHSSVVYSYVIPYRNSGISLKASERLFRAIL